MFTCSSNRILIYVWYQGILSLEFRFESFFSPEPNHIDFEYSDLDRIEDRFRKLSSKNLAGIGEDDDRFDLDLYVRSFFFSSFSHLFFFFFFCIFFHFLNKLVLVQFSFVCEFLSTTFFFYNFVTKICSSFVRIVIFFIHNFVFNVRKSEMKPFEIQKFMSLQMRARKKKIQWNFISQFSF